MVTNTSFHLIGLYLIKFVRVDFDKIEILCVLFLRQITQILIIHNMQITFKIPPLKVHIRDFIKIYPPVCTEAHCMNNGNLNLQNSASHKQNTLEDMFSNKII